MHIFLHIFDFFLKISKKNRKSLFFQKLIVIKNVQKKKANFEKKDIQV